MVGFGLTNATPLCGVFHSVIRRQMVRYIERALYLQGIFVWIAVAWYHWYITTTKLTKFRDCIFFTYLVSNFRWIADLDPSVLEYHHVLNILDGLFNSMFTVVVIKLITCQISWKSFDINTQANNVDLVKEIFLVVVYFATLDYSIYHLNNLFFRIKHLRNRRNRFTIHSCIYIYILFFALANGKFVFTLRISYIIKYRVFFFFRNKYAFQQLIAWWCNEMSTIITIWSADAITLHVAFSGYLTFRYLSVLKSFTARYNQKAMLRKEQLRAVVSVWLADI